MASRLRNGQMMPLVGLGTSKLVEEEVLGAIKAGARHLDCAAFYGNERMVGSAIKRCGVPRAELFVTTKVWNDWHRRVMQSVDMSLSELGLEYVDLVLVHWPLSWQANKPFVRDDLSVAQDVWPQLASVVASGKARSVGVSNFDEAQLTPLLHLDPPCCVNQIEAHPFYHNARLVHFCRQQGVQVVAWGPLAKSPQRLRECRALFSIARMRGTSEAAIALRWNLDRGVAVVPRSSNPRNVKANLAVLEMKPLDDHETRLIAACEAGRRRFPDFIGVWPSEATLAQRALGMIVGFVASLIFRVVRLDLVAISKRVADKRERERRACRAGLNSSQS